MKVALLILSFAVQAGVLDDHDPRLQGVDVVLLQVTGSGFKLEVRPTGCTIIHGGKRTVTNDETCKALIEVYSQSGYYPGGE